VGYTVPQTVVEEAPVGQPAGDVQLDRPGGATDAVLELPPAEHVLLGERVAPANAARLAHTEARGRVRDEGLGEARHVLAEEGGAPLGLLAAEHLAERQLGGVA